MPNETNRRQEAENAAMMREDEPIRKASEDEVLEDNAHLAREGRKELDADPKKEPKPATEWGFRYRKEAPARRSAPAPAAAPASARCEPSRVTGLH